MTERKDLSPEDIIRFCGGPCRVLTQEEQTTVDPRLIVRAGETVLGWIRAVGQSPSQFEHVSIERTDIYDSEPMPIGRTVESTSVDAFYQPQHAGEPWSRKSSVLGGKPVGPGRYSHKNCKKNS